MSPRCNGAMAPATAPRLAQRPVREEHAELENSSMVGERNSSSFLLPWNSSRRIGSVQLT